MIARGADDEDKLVKLLLVHITDGGKSPHEPERVTIRGASKPALVRFGTPGPQAVEVEGVEKALAARAAGEDLRRRGRYRQMPAASWDTIRNHCERRRSAWIASYPGVVSRRGDLALLDVLWRVFAASTTAPRRLHTCDLVCEALNLDEGRWRTANKGGQPIDEYYLRESLRKLLPTEGEYAKSKSRRWRTNSKSNPQYGYHELHLADAFSRYLGKGLPSEAPPEWDDDEDGNAPDPRSAAGQSNLQGDIPLLRGTKRRIFPTLSPQLKRPIHQISYVGSDDPFSSGSVSDTDPRPPQPTGAPSDTADPVSDTEPDEEAPSAPRKHHRYQQRTAKEPDGLDESGMLDPKKKDIENKPDTLTNFPRGPVGRRRARP